MRPSDIETVADFINDEIENRELSFSPQYIRQAKMARSAFARIIDELSRRQSSVPCLASVNGNREMGEAEDDR